MPLFFFFFVKSLIMHVFAIYTKLLLTILAILTVIADYGVDNYDIGTGFGHFGMIAEDVSS